MKKTPKVTGTRPARTTSSAMYAEIRKARAEVEALRTTVRDDVNRHRSLMHEAIIAIEFGTKRNISSQFAFHDLNHKLDALAAALGVYVVSSSEPGGGVVIDPTDEGAKRFSSAQMVLDAQLSLRAIRELEAKARMTLRAIETAFEIAQHKQEILDERLKA